MPASRPASPAAKAACSRRCWWPRTPTASTAFLDLTSGAFDLTDRGVKGRETPGPARRLRFIPSAASTVPARTFTSPPWCAIAAGKAATLPVTLIVTRPDGVEHARYTLKDRGLGGRDITLPLAASAQTGTWRALLHTDPEKDAITQVSFLVEDFVPERLDLKLEPPAAALSPEETQTIKATGRYLYGPAGSRPRHRGRHRRAAVEERPRGLSRLPVRPGR
ncbi:MAG: MG2 domain-containing protein [Hyphomicrobium sp.]